MQKSSIRNDIGTPKKASHMKFKLNLANSTKALKRRSNLYTENLQVGLWNGDFI